MLSVILLILKIIGIALLAILGLILLLILLVLLVPVRYRGSAAKDEKIDAEVHATWLLRLVHFIFTYNDGSTVKKLKIFGITVKNDVDEKEDGEEEKSPDEDNGNDLEDDKAPEEKNESGTENSKAEKDDSEQSELKEEPEKEDNTGSADKAEDTGKKSEDKNEETTQVSQEAKEPASEEDKKEDKKEDRKEDKREDKRDRDNDSDGFPDEEDKPEKKSFSEKKTEVAEKLRNIYNKLVHYKEIIDDPRVRNGIGYAKKKLFTALRHILPGKLKLDADYGFEDPSVTGYVTATLGALYGHLGKAVNARPDFENEVLRGRAQLSGRVRIGTVLFIALQVILKKDCRYVYKLIKSEREK